MAPSILYLCKLVIEHTELSLFEGFLWNLSFFPIFSKESSFIPPIEIELYLFYGGTLNLPSKDYKESNLVDGVVGHVSFF